MPLPNYTRLTPGVTLRKAEQVNTLYDEVEKIAGASLLADYAAANEDLTATRALLDVDAPILRFTPLDADQAVTFPAPGAGNHPYLLINASDTYSLTLPGDLPAIAPGANALAISDGVAWHVVSGAGGGTVDPGDLISTDADNALVQGADDKLFVAAGGGGVTPYRLAVSVASNNLTVALKNQYGDDPSPSAPVRVQIGDTVREIIAALSVTAPAGTDWCAAGNAMSATHLLYYFPYLGYNATDGVTIGFSRIPHAKKYDDFSATSTNPKYCKISTITNAGANDPYENIGMFAATLSAGAGYTWTVPTFTPANLIHRPTYDSPMMSWTPAYSAGGSMTYTLTTLTYARYRWIAPGVFQVQHYSAGTTGGTASNIIYAQFPLTIAGASDAYLALTGLRDATGGATVLGNGGVFDTDKLYWVKSDGSNFGLGTGRLLVMNSPVLAL